MSIMPPSGLRHTAWRSIHPRAWKGCSRQSRLGEDPPELPGIVQDQAVLVHRQVRAKLAVETHEPVGPAPVACLQVGVALRLRPGLELGLLGINVEEAPGQREDT